MLKKLKIYIFSLLFIIFNHNISASNENNIIPIKKPVLTNQELEKIILINLLKPLPKPSFVSKEIVKKKIVKEETFKPKFLIPKKKPLIAGSKKLKDVKISKYFSKKDFNLADKAIS